MTCFQGNRHRDGAKRTMAMLFFHYHSKFGSMMAHLILPLLRLLDVLPPNADGSGSDTVEHAGRGGEGRAVCGIGLRLRED